jgi:hypothetical protein
VAVLADRAIRSVLTRSASSPARRVVTPVHDSCRAGITDTSTPRPLLAATAQTTTLVIVVGALLVGFVVVVVREVVVTFGAAAPVTDESYELFAVSLTGLAGGVFAVGLGNAPRGRRTSRPDRIRSTVGLAYVVTYGLAGGVALVVCLVRLGASTGLLRGLAAAFLGTSVAAATAFFGVAADDRAD